MAAVVTDGLDHRAEAQMLVGRVVDGALGAVRLHQRVGAMHVVAATVFPGLLVVAGVQILDRIAVLIVDRSLNHQIYKRKKKQIHNRVKLLLPKIFKT